MPRKKQNTKRVVITGMGVLAPNGTGLDNFWQALANGKSGIDFIKQFDVSQLTTHFAGEVKDFDIEKYIPYRKARQMDRTSRLAIAATKMALKNSKINIAEIDVEKAGVFIGSSLAGHAWILGEHVKFMTKGPLKINTMTAIAAFPDAASGQIAIEFGFKGPSLGVSTACSSGSDAVGLAYRAIKRGEIDVAISGGAEAPVFPPIMSAFCVLRALSTRNDSPKTASRPFDKTRDGFVIGEGSGILILEELGHALKRGANIFCEIAGYGSTCDAYHMTIPQPDNSSAIRTVKKAMEEAGVEPDDIDYINAHGTSTKLNDAAETNIIKKVFGEKAKEIPISSIKSMIGHLIGAAGAVELIASILAMQEGVIPPTINYEFADPDCDLDYVPNKARKASLDCILSNSFGFGGKNTSLVIKRF